MSRSTPSPAVASLARPRVMVAAFLSLVVIALGLFLAISARGDDSAAGRSSANLLINTGFEDGGLFTPTGWDTTVSGQPTVLFYWDPDVKRSGSRSASIVNAWDVMPIWHNWNQMIVHAGHLVGRDLELSVWVRSDQMGGRGYVMLQCYRDTIMNYAKDTGVSRDRARRVLGYKYADDPQLELGWAREYFSADHDEWTEKKVRVYVPPTTNLVVVRFGIFGSGHVWFDDAQLAAHPARPAQALPLGKNLLVNASFEQPIDAWEFSLPPTEGATIQPDSSTARTGRYSVFLTSPEKSHVQMYMAACQVFNARSLAGKRVRLSGWIKTEDLTNSTAWLSIGATGLFGTGFRPSETVSGTRDWSFLTVEYDLPKDTYTVWARAGYSTAPGKVWYDDLKFEVLGDAPTKPATASRRARS